MWRQQTAMCKSNTPPPPHPTCPQAFRWLQPTDQRQPLWCCRFCAGSLSKIYPLQAAVTQSVMMTVKSWWQTCGSGWWEHSDNNWLTTTSLWQCQAVTKAALWQWLLLTYTCWHSVLRDAKCVIDQQNVRLRDRTTTWGPYKAGEHLTATLVILLIRSPKIITHNTKFLSQTVQLCCTFNAQYLSTHRLTLPYNFP